NDGAYRSVAALTAAGVKMAAIVDARREIGTEAQKIAAASGAELLLGQAVTRALGRQRLSGIAVASFDALKGAGESTRRIACDCLLVSGGWTPTVHLASQAGGAPRWDERLTAFLPGEARQAWRAAGACNGALAAAAALAEGAAAGVDAARACGFAPVAPALPAACDEPVADAPLPVWDARAPGKGKAFVDLQHDVTASDISLAHLEGFCSVEHLKRYTTLGMATDQ